jgi:hypothetical protein
MTAKPSGLVQLPLAVDIAIHSNARCRHGQEQEDAEGASGPSVTWTAVRTLACKSVRRGERYSAATAVWITAAAIMRAPDDEKGGGEAEKSRKSAVVRINSAPAGQVSAEGWEPGGTG